MPIWAYCQDVQFTANAPEAVRVGEQFRLTYTVNSKGSDFKYEPMQGFNILSGPNSSTSSSFQWINGKSSQTITTTYTFYLSANEPGEYTIQPASIVVDRQKHTSNSVKIKVLARTQSAHGNQNPQQGNSQSQQGRGTQGRSSSTHNESDIFITSNASKRQVYVGEQFVFSHHLYTKLDVSSFGDVKFPSYTGFWKEDVEIGAISLRQSSYNNEIYYTDEIQRNILFPQKSGDLVIEPADVQVIARVRTSGGRTGDPFFDNFFQSYDNVTYNCTSKPVTIKVLPLPTKGKPASFSGAVGNFSMNGTIDKTTLDANEAINIKFTISGSGNIKLIDKLNIKFPYDFEVYEPKISQNVRTNQNEVYGTKTFEYVIIPRTSGDFVIPSFEFSFFNPSTKSYVTLNSSEFEIHVNETIGEEKSPYTTIEREDVVSLADDIRFIRTKTPNFKLSTTTFFATPTYFILLIAIVAIAIIAVVLIKNSIKKRGDIEAIKRKKADSVALKRLQKAKEYMDSNNHDKFYDEVATALWQYISDRFSLKNSELSRDFLLKLAEDGVISQEDADKFVAVITNAEFARFAPGNAAKSMSDIYNQAIEVIKLFYTKLK